MKTIAIVGTGIMGAGMASNFLKNGYQVIIWNKHPEKHRDLNKLGALLAKTPKEAAEKADIIFEVTTDDDTSRSVWLNGIIAGSSKDKILIASSTLSAKWVDELAKICDKKKFTFFDIPLTGSRAGAENGTLTLLVGGDKLKLKKLEKDLKAISEKIMYFGPAGSGARFKLILNMIQAIHLSAFAEGFNIAKTSKMDLKAVGDALAIRLGGSTAMAWRDYHKEVHNFTVKLIEKDLRYAKLFAGEIDTPMLDEALKVYGKEIKTGKGSKDWTIITKIKR